MIRVLFAFGLVLIAVILWQPSKFPLGGHLGVLGGSESLREVANAVLRPLDAPSPLSAAQAQEKLNAARESMAIRPAEARTRKMAQAITLIESALKERGEYLRRAEAGSSVGPLDHVPGDWRMVSDRSKHINMQELHHQSRSRFFSETAIRSWRDRARLYDSAIEKLLAP